MVNYYIASFRYGNTKIPLMASLVAAVLNLVLDPVLMLPPFSRGVQVGFFSVLVLLLVTMMPFQQWAVSFN